MNEFDSQTSLLFMHIPKTAGTTFRWVVERQYPNGALHTLYPGHGPQIEALTAAARTRPPAAVMGHFRFGLHTRLPGPSWYVAFFRDPVDQVVSHFNYLTGAGNPDNQGVLRTGDGLEDFLAHDWARNLQTQFVTGLTPAEIEAAPERAYRQAVAVLTDHFLGFGIVERFAESVRVLARQLGWRVSRIPVLNRAADLPRPIKRRDLSASTVRAVEAANGCDRLLHDYVRASVHYSLREHPDVGRRKRVAAIADWLASRLLPQCG